MKLIRYKLCRFFSAKNIEPKSENKEIISIQIAEKHQSSVVKEFTFKKKLFKIETSIFATNAN